MKFLKITTLLLALLILNSCASSYKTIDPEGLSYRSSDEKEGVSMGYKYDLLHRKYAKKEKKNDVRLIAVKITNDSDRDLVFGQDIMLSYENGMGLLVLEDEKVFDNLRQKPATHLFYLLLSPVVVSTYSNDPYGYERSRDFPVGFIAGAGLAGFNLIKASSANKKFKSELEMFSLNGKTIPGGESIYGLVGVRTDNYDALQISIVDPEVSPRSESSPR